MLRKTESPVTLFSCEPDLFNAIPHPIPASKNVPDWFRKIEARMPPANRDEFPGSTIKACMPILDAFHAGYLVLSAAPVRFVVDGDDITTTWRSSELAMVESHTPAQVAGSDWQGPFLKWLNPWVIRTPPGYSSLITAPVNRPEAPFECLSAVVDTDTYPNQINFPFMWTGPRRYDDIVPAGTPLVQVIPFRREEWGMKVEALSEEQRSVIAGARKRLNIDHNGYRNLWRQPKRWRK